MVKLKQLIKYILFSIINLLVRKSSKIEPKTILLVRLDAIGDYILFRDFIELLKDEYKDYKITLVGNIVWRDIALEFDKNFIESFIWINRKDFERNPLYRYKKLKDITKRGYEIVINPTYSRSFYVDDTVVKVVNSNKKIGSIGDLSNIRKWQKSISDKYYDKLVSAKDEIIFEFYRNKEFFENLFNKKLNIKKPIMRLKDKRLDFNFSSNYAILFIGASANFRKWSVDNFVEVGRYLKDNYRYEIVVCGGIGDIVDVQNFKQLADYNYVDMVGKTSLIELLHLIYNGNLMIANETSAPHFAVALEMTNIFVISNGNHFGRFTPYPKEIWEGYYPIYHPKIEKDLNNYKKLSNSYGFGSELNINEISLKKVKNRIKEVLK